MFLVQELLRGEWHTAGRFNDYADADAFALRLGRGVRIRRSGR